MTRRRRPLITRYPRRFRLTLLALAVAAGWPGLLCGQTPEPQTRGAEIARRQAEKAKDAHPYAPGKWERRLIHFDDTGGFAAARPIGVAFGDIKSGSGIALGPSSGHTFTNGGTIRAKAEYSVHQFKLGQVFYQAPALADERVIVNGRVRWQDAPKVAMFGVGPNAPDQRAGYGEERREVSVQVLAHPLTFAHVAGGTGYERYRTDRGSVDTGEERPLLTIPAVPGLDADPSYLHSYASLALASSEYPTHSRSAGIVQGVFHDYRENGDGRYSFRQLNGMVQQLVPILYGSIVLDVSARVWTTSTTGGDLVPFFLMPSLGGADFLRGFSNYRFRDRHALLLAGNYKWYLQEFLSAVLFVEAGKVAAQRADLDLSNLEKSYGFGLHVHSAQATVLRLELARSREGMRFIIGFTPKVF